MKQNNDLLECDYNIRGSVLIRKKKEKKFLITLKRAHRSFHCLETKFSLLGGPFLTTTHQGRAMKNTRIQRWLVNFVSTFMPLAVYSANRSKQE